jgi:hypothetical protein
MRAPSWIDRLVELVRTSSDKIERVLTNLGARPQQPAKNRAENGWSGELAPDVPELAIGDWRLAIEIDDLSTDDLDW